MGISWSQKKAENLRSSKLSLHVLTDASKPEILASECYRAFFLGHPVDENMVEQSSNIPTSQSIMRT